MSLAFRLELLTTGQVIDEMTKNTMLAIIDLFNEQWGIILTEDNAQMYITHFSRALMRIKKSEPVERIDQDIYQEALDSTYFQQAEEMLVVLENKLDFTLPEDEKKYIVLNHCMILENIHS